MGLILQRDAHGEYRRTWYAVMSINGKRTTRALKTPLRGRIPLDDTGRFSLSAKGDTAFEESKQAAAKELHTVNRTRKADAIESRTNAEALGIRRVRMCDLATENAKRKKYALVSSGDEAEDGHALTEKEAKAVNKYNRSVYDILDHFAKWTANRPKVKGAKRCYLITDVDRETVAAYYAEISAAFSWQTFRKYVFILKSIFAYFTNGKAENHFQTVYDEEYKGRKSAIKDKSAISHRPPTDEQMRRVWDLTRDMSDKPYLHRLAVLAACTGLRIGDCCTLTWDKVDLTRRVITVKTAKTGTDVAVPIFDYEPTAEDYNPIFGELRRELEAAIMERRDGTAYVIPAAARIYADNPTRIFKEGKAVFSLAMRDEQEPENAVLVDEEPKRKTPAEILKLIDGMTATPERRERIRKVYELHVLGKSYKAIAAETGKAKSIISEDLAAVEKLTGEKVRRGIVPTTSTPHLRLLKSMQELTRTERKQGQRAACLYGWHSCRMYFVVTARRAGMDPEALKKITGHATVRMVEHYNNADTIEAADTMRKRIGRRAKPKAAIGATRTALPALPPAQPTNGAVALANAIQAVLTNDALTPDVKNATIAALTAQMSANKA